MKFFTRKYPAITHIFLQRALWSLCCAILLYVSIHAKPLNAQVVVHVPDTTAFRGSEISIPISLENADAAEIVSLEIFLSYDPLQVSFSGGHTSGSLVQDWLFDTVVSNGDGLDTLKLVGATVRDTIRTDGLVYTIDFALSDFRESTTMPLTLERVLFNDGNPSAASDHGSIKWTGMDGSISIDPDTLFHDQLLQVTIVDPDEDRTVEPDSITVQVSNGDQTETLVAVETDARSNEFVGTIPAVFSQGTTSSGDGIVQVEQGDEISFCYDDLLDGEGNEVHRCALTTVKTEPPAQVDATVILQPADTMRVRLIDPVLDRTADLDTVGVSVINCRTREEESLLLKETDFHSGIFFGLLATVFGTGAGIEGDGIIHAQRADTLLVEYDSSIPGGKIQYDTCMVVDPWGDASGNGHIGGLDAARILAHDVGTIVLRGLDSLSANVDADAPFGPITAYDASLVLQRRVGLIDHFPVQEAGSADHPQPESENAASSRPAVERRRISLEMQDGGLALVADDRSGIVSGKLKIENFTGRISLDRDLSGFLTASRQEGQGILVVFAGSHPIDGKGPLLLLFPNVGDRPEIKEIHFNDGRLIGTMETSVSIRPSSFALYACFPNPFNPETTIRYDLPEEAEVSLAIFDALGQQVRLLVQGVRSAGTHQVQWDGRNGQGQEVAGGVYFARLTSGEFHAVQKMLLLR